MTQQNNNEKVEETVAELNEKAEQFALITQKEEPQEDDDDTREKIAGIIDETVKALKKVADQLSDKYQEVKDNEKVQDAILTAKATAKMLYEEGKRKINELRHSEEVQATWERTKDSLSGTGAKVVHSIKSNEELMGTLETIKDVTVNVTKKTVNVIQDVYQDITENPQVQKGIEKAKAATLNVAGKAYDKLEDWLKPEENKEEGENAGQEKQ